MMDYQPEPAPRPAPYQLARERASLPGIFLAVVGGLNLVIGGILLISGVQIQKLPPDEFRRAFEKAQEDWSETQKEQWKELERQGWTIDKLRDVSIKGCIGWGVVGLVTGLIGLLGGIRMAGLRSYGLAVFGAILSAIPVISPLGCCLIGEVVGIWALVVLFSSDVHAAFKSRASPLPPDEGMLR
jgi:hypothetical protein